MAAIPDRNAYLVMGHGLEDIEGPRISVPKDVIIVTIAQCAVSTLEPQVCSFIQGFMDPTNEEILKDPIRYKKEIETKFGSQIRVYREGMDYPFFAVQYYALMEDVKTIWKSGIYKFPITDDVPEHLKDKKECNNFVIGNIDISSKVDKAILDEVYRGSIYPPMPKKKNGISNIDLTSKTYKQIKPYFLHPFHETVDTLDKPAVYYYVICRHPYMSIPTNVFKKPAAMFVGQNPKGFSIVNTIDALSFKNPKNYEENTGPTKFSSYNSLYNFVQLNKPTEPELQTLLKSLKPSYNGFNAYEQMNEVDKKISLLKNYNTLTIKNKTLKNAFENFKKSMTTGWTSNLNKIKNYIPKIQSRRRMSNAGQEKLWSNSSQSATNLLPVIEGGKLRKTRKLKKKIRKTKKAH